MSTGPVKQRSRGATGAGAAILALFVVAASCMSSPPPAGPSRVAGGGILRVAVLTSPQTVNALSACDFTFCGAPNDPQSEGGYQSLLFELDRCCLLRSLLSYNGRDISNGGATLRPDLASSLPDVSSDGLTWTFHLRRGIHYGPPLRSETVTAQDFVRSIERILSPRPAWIPAFLSFGGSYLDDYLGTYLDLAGAIKGGKAYGAGEEQHISGLQTPDDHTFVVHLTHVSGDLGYLLAMPDTAPIPPVPSHPEWRFGAAQGHDRVYSSYVVSTGPYMVQGAAQLDFSRPPQQQLPASGDAPDSLTLVRNPAWDASGDPLRAALPDRIELVPVKDETAAQRLIRSGAIDFAFNWVAPPNLLSSSSSLARPLDVEIFMSLNLAMPPLDDVHVRRAINFAIARQPLLHLWSKAHRTGIPATHIGLDDQENNLLLNFDPFNAATGDLKAAKREMAKSAYDSNHDGRCDGSVCKGIRLWARGFMPEQVATAHRVARDLARIGLQMRVKAANETQYDSTYTPQSHVPMRLDGWLKDTPSPTTFFTPLFGSTSMQGTNSNLNNTSIVGATPTELRGWGYHVGHVANVDDRIRQCLPETFAQQVRCFAAFDQYLTTKVVPWVPLISRVTGRLTSSGVSHLNLEPAAINPVPSLDRVTLRPDSKLAPLPNHAYPVPTIPDGVYRYTISRADLLRFDPKYKPANVAEHTGTTTVYLRGGRFESVERANHPIVDPIQTGIYKGHGHQVTFQVQQPAFNAMTVPEARWSFDGHALRFKLPGCGTLSSAGCKDIRAIYEAHPWIKVADLP